MPSDATTPEKAMTAIRPTAVAGQFYPGDPGVLADTVRAMLAGVAENGPVPKAMIAPHAGYVYSGPVAATAYARIRAARDVVTRIVLIGPAHRVPVRGLAVTTAEAFATPLGAVPVDREAVARVLALPQVTALDAAHAPEHSLEVHLPFLQEVLSRFSIVPLVAGDATAAEVAEVLEILWGGPETLIVISSDLSHYYDYETAQRMDAATTQAIEALRPEDIGPEQACGRVPIAGLLTVARHRGLACATVDLRNSGDTAGPRDQVVGYGAYLFLEDEAEARLEEEEAKARLNKRYGRTLMAVASASIDYGLDHGDALPVAKGEFATELQAERASFVTLKVAGKLRGCIGSPRAWRPLIEDVAENAFRAAFKDPRFSPVTVAERDRLGISISVLTPAVEIPCRSEAALVRMIRPGVDGVILEDGNQRGLFLPAVWEALPDPKEFVRNLKVKAGLSPDHWSETTKVYRFGALSISPFEGGGTP
jgi:AmmeMemoRadiSam system protein B/AmmeMemoRadiSam system protein A